ncbi:Protein of unknown function [Bacillus mycoides]|nr:Protein of unknown function [Bacillus mycoides]
MWNDEASSTIVKSN